MRLAILATVAFLVLGFLTGCVDRGEKPDSMFPEKDPISALLDDLLDFECPSEEEIPRLNDFVVRTWDMGLDNQAHKFLMREVKRRGADRELRLLVNMSTVTKLTLLEPADEQDDIDRVRMVFGPEGLISCSDTPVFSPK